MEKSHKDNYYILKNSCFMSYIEDIIKDTSIIIKHVIIPIRSLEMSAKSSVKHGKEDGGLLNAADELYQIDFYKNILTNYILALNMISI